MIFKLFRDDNSFVLPNEILLQIFAYLSYHEKFYISPLVNKAWCAFTKNAFTKDKEHLTEMLQGALWDEVQAYRLNLSDALEIHETPYQDRVESLPLVIANDELFCGLLTTNLGMLFRKNIFVTDTDLISVFELLVLTNPRLIKFFFSKVGYQLLEENLITMEDIEKSSLLPCYTVSGLKNLYLLKKKHVQKYLAKKYLTLEQILRYPSFRLRIILSNKGFNCLEKIMFTIENLNYYYDGTLKALLTDQAIYCLNNQLITAEQFPKVDNHYLKNILSAAAITLLEKQLITADELINITHYSKWMEQRINFKEKLKILATRNGQYCLANKLITIKQVFFHYDNDELIKILSSEKRIKNVSIMTKKLSILRKMFDFKGVFGKTDYDLKIINENQIEIMLVSNNNICDLAKNLKDIILCSRVFFKPNASIINIYSDKDELDSCIDYWRNESPFDKTFYYNKNNYSPHCNELDYFSDEWDHENLSTNEFGYNTNNYSLMEIGKSCQMNLMPYPRKKLHEALTLQQDITYSNTYLTTRIPKVTLFLAKVNALIQVNDISFDCIITPLKIFFYLYRKFTMNTDFNYLSSCFESLNQRCATIANAITWSGYELMIPDIIQNKNITKSNINFKPQYYVNCELGLIPILDLIKTHPENWFSIIKDKNLLTIAGDISKKYYEALYQVENLSLFGKLKQLAQALSEDEQKNLILITEIWQYWFTLTKTQRIETNFISGKYFNEKKTESLSRVMSAIFSKYNLTGDFDSYEVYYISTVINIHDFKEFLSYICQDEYCFETLINIIPPQFQKLISEIDLDDLRTQFEDALDNPKFTRICTKKPDFTLMNTLFTALQYILPGEDINKAYDILENVVLQYAHTLTVSDILFLLICFSPKIPKKMDYIPSNLIDTPRKWDKFIEILSSNSNYKLKSIVISYMKMKITSIDEIVYFTAYSYIYQKLEICQKLLKNLDDPKIPPKDFVELLKILNTEKCMTLIMSNENYVRKSAVNWFKDNLKFLPFTYKIKIITLFLKTLKIQAINKYLEQSTEIKPSNYTKNKYGAFFEILHFLENTNRQIVKTNNEAITINSLIKKQG